MGHPFLPPKRAPALALLVALAATACRSQRAAPPPGSRPGEREVLLAKIAALDEVAPCAAAGPPALRLVEAELAGDAASVTFDCGGGAGAVRGKVTFFRLGDAWTISTKEIAPAPH